MKSKKKAKVNPFKDFEEIGRKVHAYVDGVPSKNFEATVTELLKAPKFFGEGGREREYYESREARVFFGHYIWIERD